MNVLFLGDVVGRPGREAVAAKLPAFWRFPAIDVCIANGENSADGDGVTEASAEALFSAGVDVVTGGNHSFKRREAYDYLNEAPYVLRPANYSPDAPECTVNINSPDTATLTVRVYTYCGYVERSIFINHDSRPNVVIYPNPTDGDFNIVLYGMRGKAVIVIYDYLGQYIGRFSVDTDLEGIVIPYSLVGKAAGVYLVVVHNDFDTITKKVVKIRPATHYFYNWEW